MGLAFVLPANAFLTQIDGAPVMKESAIIEPGSSILAPFKTSVGNIGSMICFDLRFPEISLALKRQHADILLFPSAFTVTYVEASTPLAVLPRTNIDIMHVQNR